MTGATGPTGATGATGPAGSATLPVDLLSAFSTPSQPITSTGTLVFDRNASSYGTSVTHTAESADFTITQPGVYVASFNGGITPGSGVTFPYSVVLYMQLNGSAVSGASAVHIFHTSTETVNFAFTQPITVSSAPAVLQIAANGDNFLYNNVSMTVYRLGDVPQ